MVEKKYYNNALPTGYLLDNFEIIRVLGVGGFGIAYLAKDIYLEVECVIKEYMPSEFSYRDQLSGEVRSINSNSNNFVWGLNKFLNEAKIIQRCKHHNIVEVIRFFKANNTAYFVMPYFKGNSLSQLLSYSAPNERVTEQKIKAMIIPLLEGLKILHSQNIFHRDIKPSNIYICDEDDKPILIDFGAARFSLGSHSRSIAAIVTRGYSPHEQYHLHGRQGAWTDIYSMGAVMYRLISGKTPIESPERIFDDSLIPATELGKGMYSPSLLLAIDRALTIKESNRPQSIEEWLSIIDSNIIPATPIRTLTPIPSPIKPPLKKVTPIIPTIAWVVIIFLVVTIIILGVKVFQTDPILVVRQKKPREALDTKFIQKSEEKKNILLLIDNFTATVSQNDISKALKYYTEPIDYYSKKTATHAFIIADANRYIKNYPKRTFYRDSTPNLSWLSQTEVMVSFRMGYQLWHSEDKKTITGENFTKMHLKKIQGKWKITAVSSSKLISPIRK